MRAGIPNRSIASIACVMAAVAVYLGWRVLHGGPPPLQAMPRAVQASYDEWSAPFLASWKTATMTRLSDDAGLRTGIVSLIGAAPLPNGVETSEAKKAALADCLVTFLSAWASANPQEYLRRVRPYRLPLERPGDGAAVLGSYRGITGDSLPLHLSALSLLTRFWEGRPDCPRRPDAIALSSSDALIDFRLYNPKLGPRESTRFGRLDTSITEPWVGPLSTSIPCVTAPTVGIDEIQKEFGPWVEQVFLGALIQSASGERFPVQIKCYWSPGQRQWHVQSVSGVTTRFLTWAY